MKYSYDIDSQKHWYKIQLGGMVTRDQTSFFCVPWSACSIEVLHYSDSGSLHDLDTFSLNILVCCKQYW